MARTTRRIKKNWPNPDRLLAIFALVISFLSAIFSYQQMLSSERQLLLNSQQLRPYLTFDPTFFPIRNEMQIDVYTRNHSPLPARVLFGDIAAAVDGQIFGDHFFSTSPDIIHQEKNGVSTPPPIPKQYASKIIKGESSLIIATCAIYTSATDTDKRRWIVNMLSEYVPGLHIGSHKLLEELEVSNDTNACEAKNLFRKITKQKN